MQADSLPTELPGKPIIVDGIMITLVVVPAGAHRQVRAINMYWGIFHSFVQNSDTQNQSLQFSFILPSAPTHLNYDYLHPTKYETKINKQKALLNEVESLEAGDLPFCDNSTAHQKEKRLLYFPGNNCAQCSMVN